MLYYTYQEIRRQKMTIQKLPDRYPYGDYVRIGPHIYIVRARIFSWHLLTEV